MTIEIIRDALAWCILINWGLLLWWFLFFTLAHDWTYRYHSNGLNYFIGYSGNFIIRLSDLIWGKEFANAQERLTVSNC
jgi:hypothetical protein